MLKISYAGWLLVRAFDFDLYKPVVDVARVTQAVADRHTDRFMDRHCATIRVGLACASRANSARCTQMSQMSQMTPRINLA